MAALVWYGTFLVGFLMFRTTKCGTESDKAFCNGFVPYLRTRGHGGICFVEHGRRFLSCVLRQWLIEGANSALSRVILFMSALNLGSVERGNPAPSGWGIARLVAF